MDHIHCCSNSSNDQTLKHKELDVDKTHSICGCHVIKWAFNIAWINITIAAILSIYRFELVGLNIKDLTFFLIAISIFALVVLALKFEKPLLLLPYLLIQGTMVVLMLFVWISMPVVTIYSLLTTAPSVGELAEAAKMNWLMLAGYVFYTLILALATFVLYVNILALKYFQAKNLKALDLANI